MSSTQKNLLDQHRCLQSGEFPKRNKGVEKNDEIVCKTILLKDVQVLTLWGGFPENNPMNKESILAIFIAALISK